jgi:Holliday junction resolvase RusA-like endonuclease
MSVDVVTDNWVEVPIPPSANALWAPRVIGGSFKGMHKTSKYVSWLQTAVLLLRAGLPTNLTPPLKLMVRAFGGRDFNGDVRDLDNIIKPTLDAIRMSGRIADDTAATVAVIDVTYTSGSKRQPGICRVWLEELR